MKNFVQKGEFVTITAPAGGTTSGVGVLIGDLFGIATNTVGAGESTEVLTEGVVEIAKTSALAIGVGDVLYWDNTNKVVNKTAASQKSVGIAVEAAANPSSTVAVKLTPNITAA